MILGFICAITHIFCHCANISEPTNINTITQLFNLNRQEVSLYIDNDDVLTGYSLDKSSNNYFAKENLVDSTEEDTDNDGIVNSIDIDDDNDGILDFHENIDSADFDNDGIPNQFDIDSDNDGILDYIEWQKEGSNIKYSFSDINQDGWDDAFDSNLGGNYYEQVDTDLDGMPDFLDLDSDDDDISDFIEAYDIDNDCFANCYKRESDLDKDGLDDNCDNVYGWNKKTNPMGSNAILPDNNKNGIRDWRDLTNYAPEGNETEAEAGEFELFVYPNPVQSNCTIMVPEMETAQNSTINVKLYNSSGALLLLKKVTSPTFVLDLTPYKKGTYFIHIHTENGNYHQKVLKSN